MSPTQWAVTFGGIAFAAALVIAVACCRAAARSGVFDDEFTAQRSAGMGDLSTVPEEDLGVDECEPDEETPIFDETSLVLMEHVYDWHEAES